MTKEALQSQLTQACLRLFGCAPREATEKQIYRALCMSVRRELEDRQRVFQAENRAKERKQVYYMSMEFLVGTSLRNHLSNLGLYDAASALLAELGFSLEALCAMEPDAGLGNGGLGRLASCYMDAATGLSYPVTGFSIRYEFGIFRQKIVGGWQIEFPDDWLALGDVWLRTREDDAVEVRFGGTVHEWVDQGRFKAAQVGYQSVMAVPHDFYVSGANSQAANKLTLWSAVAPQGFDMAAFSRGEYARALERNTMAETISKVLYPADDHLEGKRLRLKQQYLLVSASLQSILKEHYKKYRTVMNLADKVSIHINDTHPALCVPELMRLLIDEYECGWDEAWSLTCRCLSYTNHTVMAEALEHWQISLFEEQLPRVYGIVREIDRRTRAALQGAYPGDHAKIDYMAPISGGEVRMANLCLAACHKVNGVSQLHTQILKDGIFRDYANLDPSRFVNITNGIAYRRWLCQANPALNAYLTELIGPGFTRDARELEKLMAYRDNDEVLARLREIKLQNKCRLAACVSRANGVNLDPESLFDVQVKRLHEYKRQLLNVLHILKLYLDIKDDPHRHVTPRTFLFAAKASAGYQLAKQIISLIVAVSELVNADPDMQGKLKVVFMEDYKVSLAELIIPAAELSEQISVAGKEASGTGNMKLMINGAVTLGTLDGANVEICQQVGEDNMFLFGLHAEQVEALWRSGYDPRAYLSPQLERVLQMLTSGVLGKKFDDITASLLTNRFGAADGYMTIADFDSYCRAQARAAEVWEDRTRFEKMSLVNIAKAGIFSSDRAVEQYAREIWNLD